MPFPIHYRAQIHEAGGESNKNLFLTLMPIELRGIGLQHVLVQGDRILFGRGTPRYSSGWNLLTALDSGDIAVISSGGDLTVAYRLSFTGFFVLMALLFLLGLIVWTIVAHPSIQIVVMGASFLLVWLVLMGLSCWHVAQTLGGVIKDVLARSV